MKSNPISKRETAALLQEVAGEWGVDIPQVRNLMVHHIADDAQLFTGGGMRILKIGETYVPFLSEARLLERFPYVVVDMGAVKFMCDGANLMRPGIKDYSEFGQGQLVAIMEESQRKFLAVGRAEVPSSDLDAMDRGLVIRNMHYISDKFWDAGKAIRD